MAVFRVERNKGYTVMSNHHLRNKELSLKAKGLLSQMLSLPEDWDYTLAGLSFINREKIDATAKGGRYMQDEINEKTIALYIKTGKLTAQTLQKAMKTLLAQMKKQKDKTPQGKQTLKQLMKQNAGVSNIEITEGNIKAFESTAKKYGIDFALKKDTTENPPRYLVFFKGRDADVLTAAFKEFSAKKLTQEKKPSIRKLLSSLKEKAAGLNTQRDKVKNKDREVSL